jgi:hypothetical protein
MFIGSSVEGLPIAQALAEELEYQIDSVIWNQRVFDLSRGTLPALLDATRRFDYAAFILSADDVTRIRQSDYMVARDNVVFELGMFFGALGTGRCFFLVPKNAPDFHVASDLAGITPATYDPNHSGGIRPGVTTACNHIRAAVAGPAGYESLTGRWQQVWNVTRDGKYEEIPSDADLVQADVRVRASWSALGKLYEMDGTIERGNVLTGRWRDSRVGPTYFGSFQLLIDPLGNEMTGVWVGWSRTGIVRSGDWRWRRS